MHSVHLETRSQESSSQNRYEIEIYMCYNTCDPTSLICYIALMLKVKNQRSKLSSHFISSNLILYSNKYFRSLTDEFSDEFGDTDDSSPVSTSEEN